MDWTRGGCGAEGGGGRLFDYIERLSAHENNTEGVGREVGRGGGALLDIGLQFQSPVAGRRRGRTSSLSEKCGGVHTLRSRVRRRAIVATGRGG